MLNERNQVHDHVRSETERPDNGKEDPKHELVGTRDPIALRVNENHDHLVEEYLDVADRDEQEVPEGENHESD